MAEKETAAAIGQFFYCHCRMVICDARDSLGQALNGEGRYIYLYAYIYI